MLSWHNLAQLSFQMLKFKEGKNSTRNTMIQTKTMSEEEILGLSTNVHLKKISLLNNVENCFKENVWVIVLYW